MLSSKCLELCCQTPQDLQTWLQCRNPHHHWFWRPDWGLQRIVKTPRINNHLDVIIWNLNYRRKIIGSRLASGPIICSTNSWIMNKQRFWWLRNKGSFSIHFDIGQRAATGIWRVSGGAWWEACGRAADWASVAGSWAASWNGLWTLGLFQEGSKTGQNCRKELLPQCMIILIDR